MSLTIIPVAHPAGNENIIGVAGQQRKILAEAVLGFEDDCITSCVDTVVERIDGAEVRTSHRVQQRQNSPRIHIGGSGARAAVASAGNKEAMVGVELTPKVCTLVAYVVRRNEPVFGYLKFVTEAPLLYISGMRIEREIDVHTFQRRNLVLRRRQSTGEGIASRISSVRVGESAGGAGYRDAVAPRRGVGVLGVKERFRPIVEDAVRGS